MLHRLFHEEDVRLFHSQPLAFECACSRVRIEKVLRSMGEEELYSILDEQEKIEVTCEFCSEMQIFSREDVGALLSTVH
ncbi:MAG: molecular chaperone Hsp33 [Pseudomonadota bacterium]|nr:molecular chaperone Hsp33 [Pseudomonadota bacterium]